VIVRRCANAVATLVVAIAVMLAVPVSQLTTVQVVTSCCCPDPSDCHCPHQTPDHGTQPSARPCHQQHQIIVAPQLPSFAAPTEIAIAPLAQIVAPPVIAMIAPHAPPTPKRPDAPS
jgi:hypothetical protein